jgi:MoaA/NifB/PqqE/SkfB family radical SAM enzyme
LPEEPDPRFIRSLVRVLATAIVRSPYGTPLDLHLPLVLSVSAGTYCPFKCANCYSASSAEGDDQAALGSMSARMAEIIASDVPIVLITGGEPLAFAETRTWVRAAADVGKWVYVFTNASVESYLDLAVRYRENLEFVFSVWGAREKHNELRGAKSFERIERNLRLLNDRGRRGNLLIVMTTWDPALLEQAFDLAEQFDIDHLRVVRRIGVGRTESAKRLQLSSAMAQELRCWRGRIKRHVRTALIDIPELRAARGASMLKLLFGIAPFASCAAGAWTMHMDSRGRASSCFAQEKAANAALPGASMVDQWQGLKWARPHSSNGGHCHAE